MYQSITIVGNLGKDPETTYTPTGIAVCKFSVATKKSWTSADGESKSKTLWFNVTTWRKQAELMNRYLHKGSKVLIVGELEEADGWVDKDKKIRTSLRITAQTVKFLDGVSAGATNAAEAPDGSENTMDGAEIPF